MADNTPYRASSPDLVIVPLRSDPPWLSAGMLGVTLACIAVVMLYMRLLPAPRQPIALAIIPGLALATFIGAYVGWWGRRRGGTMALEAAPERVVLREPRRREELVDRVIPFAAVLLRDTATSRRLLVLSQSGEPITVLDASRATAAAASAAWTARTIALDLSGAAISPSTAHVLTVAVHATLDPLLGALESDLTEASPLVSYPLPSGEVLRILTDELRVGSRVMPYATARARRIAIATPTGDSQAISLVAGDTTLLLARQEPSETGEAPATLSEAPDAYLPPLLYELVASRFVFAPAPGSPDGVISIARR